MLGADMKKLGFSVFFLLIWLPPIHGQAFGGEVYHFASSSTNAPPGRCILKDPIPAGGRVVILAAEDGNDYHISHTSDSKGNVYTQSIFYRNDSFQSSNISIWSAFVSKALSTSDTVTISWNATTSLYRSYGVSIVYLTGTALNDQPAATAEKNAYLRTPSVTVPGKVSGAKTVVVGILLANNFVWTIRNGTIYDSQQVNINYDFFFKELTSIGLYDPSGTATPVPGTYAAVWASFNSLSPTEEHPFLLHH